MGLGTELVKFFYTLNYRHTADKKIHPNSIGDFIQKNNNCHLLEVNHICLRLSRHGFLIQAGQSHGSPPANQCYYAYKFDEEVASYGIYDFYAFGLKAVRDHFSNSVVPVIVKKTAESDETNGTGFLLEDRKIITARHCIFGKESFRLPTGCLHKTKLKNIIISKDDRVDLALLEFETDPIPGTPGFKVGQANLLDDILTMGYPPVPCFQTVLVAEKAQIAGFLQTSTGQIVGEEKSYLDNQKYFLVSARVKGGNSGGPIVNVEGCVVGVVTNLPAGSGCTPDLMGYGVAVTSSGLMDFMNACNNSTADVKEIVFTQEDDIVFFNGSQWQ